MATYVYETIPRRPNELPMRFEVTQSMKDAPLTRHPDTGEPVRRVISGGSASWAWAARARQIPGSPAGAGADATACFSIQDGIAFP